MENERNIFSSNIIRNNNKFKNNLHELLCVDPVKPLSVQVTPNNLNQSNCDFIPKENKVYIPKKKNGRKVKTVRNIRNIFEDDVYSYLPIELERQRNVLLRKIRFGSLRDEKTKEIACNMLKSDTSMVKSAWQMLTNINPEGHKFSSQYIMWKGKRIQINGSKGGKYKFICNYDIGNIRESSRRTITKSNNTIMRRRLLHQSLNVKFKPGPLSKKKYLDTSYQKYQFGKMKVIDLPKPGIEVQTSYGKPLAPVIDTLLHNSFFQDDKGLMLQEWANFAVSVLGKVENGIVSQASENSYVSFNLNYKSSQNRILMREENDMAGPIKFNDITKSVTEHQKEPEAIIISEVEDVMRKIINAVEISLQQDELYSGEDDPRQTITNNCYSTNTNSNNNKNKRKFGELDRLDVTIIRLFETPKSSKIVPCLNEYCALGCVCDSLKCFYNLKRHCGQIDCMFKCKCDFSKYKYVNSLDNDDSDIIPGLVQLDKRLGQTLAKEEHKFHQTVIVTDEKSILLKSDKRNWKTSKKYADFYTNMNLKSDQYKARELSIVCPKLNCKNIERWCMVHNLYKCFCECKFTESARSDSGDKLENMESHKVTSDTTDARHITENRCEYIESDVENKEETMETTSKTRAEQETGSGRPCFAHKNICARTKPYKGRKFNARYYYITNQKISEMEKNDKLLHKKLVTISNIEDDFEMISSPTKEESPHSTLKELLCNVVEQTTDKSNVDEVSKRLPPNTRLVAWLETSYKQYKECLEQGIVKFALGPPIVGKLCLYSWDFILSRFRERKNYFLISKQKPYRIFMAVDIKNSLFEECTNISDINLSEIHKYPITVKNLLTNASDLKENFCILCGFKNCWELIGSVTKVNENKNSHTLYDNSPIENVIIPDEKLAKQNTSDDAVVLEEFPSRIDNVVEVKDVDSSTEQNDAQSETPHSRWFVMKVENDFSEIQFYKKGFFVKYESVIKAINVARVSGKTVRLSSQKCSDKSDPQFGIYAIPSTDNLCVFIGPYERNEDLGIEAIKKVPATKKRNISQNSTRGMWILIKTIDNLKVIDNPLMFITPNFLQNDQMITLESASAVKCNPNIPEIACHVQNETAHKNSKEVAIKQVKPIKIRKTNGFYHLTSSGCLKPIQSPEKNIENRSLLKYCPIASLPSVTQTQVFKRNLGNGSKSVVPVRPIAEIAPQLKEDKTLISQTKKCGRMMILKPEEINKRSIMNQNETCAVKDEISMDIENFLSTAIICDKPKDEVYVISDDENETSDLPLSEDSASKIHKNVWFLCKNIENLGWIAGKKNSEEKYSFEFPGFKASQFYTESEVLKKICAIFARKVYIPKHIEMNWQVVDDEYDIKSFKKLEGMYLNSDYTLTRKGLMHKSEIITKIRGLNNSKQKETDNDIQKDDLTELQSVKDKCKIMSDLEEANKTLEEESSHLWDKTLMNRSEIIESFSLASEELRKELTQQLECIKSSSEN